MWTTKNYAHNKYLCKLLLSEGTDPVQQTALVVSRNIKTAVMKGESTVASAKAIPHRHTYTQE